MAALAGEEDLGGRISDLEGSLATALARLEVAKQRERRLRRENNELRACLRESGIEALEGHRDDEGQPLAPLSPRKRASTASAAVFSEDSQQEGGCVEQHQVSILTPEGKVPAVLLSSGECFEFVELRARITPAEFVGQSWNGPTARGATKGSRIGSGVSWRRLAARRVAPVAQQTRTMMRRGHRRGMGTVVVAQQAAAPAQIAEHPELTDAGEAEEREELQPRTAFVERDVGGGGVAPPGYAKASDDSEVGRKPRCKKVVEDVTSTPDIPSTDEPSNSGYTSGGSDDGQWDILWKTGGGSGPLRRMTISASNETRAYIHQQVESWATKHAGSDVHHVRRLSVAEDEETTTPRIESRPTLICSGSGGPSSLGQDVEEKSGQEEELPQLEGESGEVLPPTHLSEGKWAPKMIGRSDLLSTHHVACLSNMLPRRHQQAPWQLTYSTEQHGISLHTLYRKAASFSHTFLVIQDGAGYVFGSYNTEAWRMSARYYGTGESFVFQIQPHMLAYPWKRKSKERNDFYQFATSDSIAVGGGGHFAIWMDQDLAYGNSGVSDTYGNPCLSGSSEFRIKSVELWAICI
eukprot:CAMPEP_0177765122 /NCGR_PEP_ID=MMETSP0491_2-20121128/7820_1 /TAXON_ID=63592 /ORGANISM="Tetraselmis chuii, Strain PLY429" /LENGTH=578 /DNA_ID=CAMNT_0019281443 /DNA_START=100 /DNA_END=1838 /DNA_ORIENTATION=-